MILILGRFQPMHNGHLKVIKDAALEDEVVIAVGSCDKSGQEKNPFTAEERVNLIKKALEGVENFTIITVPDIVCDKGYVKHVIEKVGRKPDKVITENDDTEKIFEESGYNVQKTERHFGISGTEIRKRICEDGEWKSLVPAAVAAEIERINGIDKVKKTCKLVFF